MDRALIYLALVAYFYDGSVREVLREEVGVDMSNCDLSALRASLLRKDYDGVTRSLLPRVLTEFYENCGYTPAGEPDSLVTMLAFMAQLAVRPDTLKIQHRFLNVHLIPTVRFAVEICPGLKPLLEILEEDLEVVRGQL
ncbi:MAG: hypothetical protein ACK4SY_06390 [Pyrobaculum sp.]